MNTLFVIIKNVPCKTGIDNFAIYIKNLMAQIASFFLLYKKNLYYKNFFFYMMRTYLDQGLLKLLSGFGKSLLKITRQRTSR